MFSIVTASIRLLRQTPSLFSHESTNIHNVLPEKAMIRIFGNLEASDLLMVRRVCRAWDVFHKNNALWESLILQDFHDFKDRFGGTIESFHPLIQECPRIAYHTFSMCQKRSLYKSSSSTPEGAPTHGFDALPVEVRMNIFGYLGAKESIEAGEVNKEWNSVLKDNQLWKSLLLRDFHDCKDQRGEPIIKIFGSLVNEDAQLVYQICHLYKKCFLNGNDFYFRRTMQQMSGLPHP